MAIRRQKLNYPTSSDAGLPGCTLIEYMVAHKKIKNCLSLNYVNKIDNT